MTHAGVKKSRVTPAASGEAGLTEWTGEINLTVKAVFFLMRYEPTLLGRFFLKIDIENDIDVLFVLCAPHLGVPPSLPAI